MKGWALMNKRTMVAALATLAGSGLTPASAAGQMQAEVRGGLTVGSHSGSAAALDIAPAVSFDVVVKRQMMPSIAVFGGFFRTAFGCREGFCKDREIVVVGNHGCVLSLAFGQHPLEFRSCRGAGARPRLQHPDEWRRLLKPC